MPCGLTCEKGQDIVIEKSIKSLRRFYLLDRVSDSDGQTDRERQPDGQRGRQMDRETARWTERQPDGQRDRQMDRETCSD